MRQIPKTRSFRRCFLTVLLGLGMVLPVPALAASGLAVPMPGVVYTLAVGLFERTSAVTVSLGGFWVKDGVHTAAPLTGEIELTAGERTALESPADQFLFEEDPLPAATPAETSGEPDGLDTVVAFTARSESEEDSAPSTSPDSDAVEADDDSAGRPASPPSGSPAPASPPTPAPRPSPPPPTEDVDPEPSTPDDESEESPESELTPELAPSPTAYPAPSPAAPPANPSPPPSDQDEDDDDETDDEDDDESED